MTIFLNKINRAFWKALFLTIPLLTIEKNAITFSTTSQRLMS